MGRPVNKRIFQTPTDPDQVQLKVTAKLPGIDVGEGTVVAQKALAKGIESVVFDRGGFLYHGRIQELADGAREAGLQF